MHEEFEKLDVYGIGNTLIDILAEVSDSDLAELDVHKGTMHLIDVKRRACILDYLKGRQLLYRCGGSAPNTMIALASLGARALIAGCVGDDNEGLEYRRQMEHFSAISNIRNGLQPTGSSIVLVTPDTERTMNTYLGANREFCKDDIDFDLLKKAGWFYFTGYMWDTDEQKGAILAAVEFCKTHGIRIAFDVADPFAVSRNKDQFLHLIRSDAHLVFANREEAAILLDSQTAEDSAARLAAICDIAVIKNGSQGSIVQSGSEAIPIPVYKVKALDSTGAGDMYAAGFLYGQIKGFSLQDSGLIASWLASRIVSMFGAQFRPQEFSAVKEGLEGGAWRI